MIYRHILVSLAFIVHHFQKISTNNGIFQGKFQFALAKKTHNVKVHNS